MGAIVTQLKNVPTGTTLVFHHIPKTAGSTLDAVLDANYPADAMIAILSPVAAALAAFRALPADARRRLRVVRGHALHGVHAHLEQPCVYAVLLREPLDRVASQYFFIRGAPAHPRHAALRAGGATLLDYLRSGVNPQADNGQVRALSGMGDGVGPDVPFGGCTRAMLDTAMRNLETMYALVGLTERFDEFLVRARRALGWREIRYARRKVTRQRPGVAGLTPAEREALQACNQLDAELYRMALRLADAARRRQPVWFGAELAWFQRRNKRGLAA